MWSMKVTDVHGTILQLTQESGVSNKDIAEKEQQSNELEHSEGAQVVDGIERPTGDQKSSAELKQTQSKSKKFTRIEGVMVEQIEKERRDEQAKRDEEATAASGVVLSIPHYRRRRSKFKTGCTTQEEDPRPQEGSRRNNIINQDEAGNPSTLTASEDVPDSDDSHPSTETGLDTSIPQGEETALDITRQEFINAQREDLELQQMWQQVEQQDERTEGSPRMDEIFAGELHATAYIDDVAYLGATPYRREKHFREDEGEGTHMQVGQVQVCTAVPRISGSQDWQRTHQPPRSQSQCPHREDTSQNKEGAAVILGCDELLQEIYPRLLEDSSPSH